MYVFIKLMQVYMNLITDTCAFQALNLEISFLL